jgi:hypothetical protein
MTASIGSAGRAMAWSWSRCGPGWRRPCLAAGIFGGAVAFAMALSACTSPQASGPAAAGRPASPPGMSCAWPWALSAQTDNTAFPDAAGIYWGQPIVASAGTRIVLSGRFPDARYASVDVYTPRGVGVSLPDYRIAPQSGSVNPWRRKAAPGGRFAVTIRPDPAPGQANTLPLPPGTTSKHPGYLVYRVFLPAGGDFSAVPLPVLTVEGGGVVRRLAACRGHNAALIFPATAAAAGTGGSGAAASPPPPLKFYKPARRAFNNAGLANVDTTYVLAYLIRPPAADVVVVTAKAPTFAPGSHPSRWPARREDVRYWSMCIGVGIRGVPVVANKLPGGRTDYGCRADEATRLNAAGDYTYVIGGESQRAAISRIPGVTFLPFSITHPAGLYLLALRNILVSTSFARSPQGVTRADDPAAAAAGMGPYYPRVTVCSLAVLAAKGLEACQ